MRRALSVIPTFRPEKYGYTFFPSVSRKKRAIAIDIDDIDLALLRMLQENNQQTVRVLAAEVGLSTPTCLRRIRALRQAGVIRHDTSLLEPSKLGLGLTCYAEVALHVHSASAVQTFGLRMRRLGAVIACDEIAGEADFLLHLILKDMHAYSDFARDHLASDSNVRSYRSLFVIRRHKFEHRLPI